MNQGSSRPLSLGPLRGYDAVAWQFGFSAAGKPLHLMQPGVSRRIRSLED